MKVGIISDIHGDYEALQTALDRLDNQHHADTILCAGDLIGRGPDPNRVVNCIRERSIITVRGNHDEWIYESLTKENRDFLTNLPLEWREEFVGVRLYMCHGKPGNNIWGLYEAHASSTLLNLMLGSLAVDVFVTGHTHVPMFVSVDKGCVVNPGSLYTLHTSRATSHTYGVLSLPEITFDLFDITKADLLPVMQASVA
ncbi:MAG: metallophosphoesterase family protein [Phototrophicaceae bacterium]